MQTNQKRHLSFGIDTTGQFRIFCVQLTKILFWKKISFGSVCLDLFCYLEKRVKLNLFYFISSIEYLSLSL